ncbi:RDD family protein [Thalassotalea agarivorans]|uniref:Uncharacterized membrane protein YckC, RDD family n=1 Tax=Thalassotalea agarivorans TaxID=349064 RepID=A0A1I0I4T4_THASX|nr:RDD family protein [Thalassotalea agarivorans]SET91532.1 Uncharacterized membrane protein YckC, RDD family [Thalassotalea agarivorans]
MSVSPTSGEFPRAGFMRRFGAWVYDFLLAVAVYMVAGGISFGIFGALFAYQVIPNQGFEHAIDLQRSSIVYNTLVYGWNIAWVALFFVFFWARSGQTLGMRAWRLKLQNQDGSLISKKTGFKRLLPTLLGLGNLLVIFDRKNKLSLQDRLTDTEVVVLSLEANRGRL